MMVNPHSTWAADDTHRSEAVSDIHFPVFVRYRWTVEELLEAQRWAARQSMRRPFRIGLGLVIGFISLAGFGLLTTEGTSLFSFFCVALGAYWFVLRTLLGRWFTRHHFVNRTDQDVEVEWTFTHGLIQTQSSQGKSEFGWEVIAKLVQVPTGVLLYPNDKMYYWLPAHAFDNDRDFDDFVRAASTKISNHCVIS